LYPQEQDIRDSSSAINRVFHWIGGENRRWTICAMAGKRRFVFRSARRVIVRSEEIEDSKDIQAAAKASP